MGSFLFVACGHIGLTLRLSFLRPNKSLKINRPRRIDCHDGTKFLRQPQQSKTNFTYFDSFVQLFLWDQQMYQKKVYSNMGPQRKKNLPHSLPPIPTSAVSVHFTTIFTYFSFFLLYLPIPVIYYFPYIHKVFLVISTILASLNLLTYF